MLMVCDPAFLYQELGVKLEKGKKLNLHEVHMNREGQVEIRY